MIRHWDALGRLLDQSNKVNTSGHEINWTFAYNPVGQLRQSTQDTEVYDYAPDVQAAEAKTFDGLNRDATIAGVTGGYDLRSNLTFDGNRTFVYDVENRLVSASGTTIPGATFEYDPEGRLSKLTSGTMTPTVTTFLYDGVNLIGEYDGSGNLKRRPGRPDRRPDGRRADGIDRYWFDDRHLKRPPVSAQKPQYVTQFSK